MRAAYDFTPLYRTMIGVDRMASLVDAATRGGGEPTWPNYDVEKIGEDAYRITVATAGFTQDELEVTALPNLLVVTGRKQARDETRVYLHQGIAGQGFERRFELADYVVVKAARYGDGLLSIDLVREVPEAVKPRTIPIATGAGEARVHRLNDRQTKAA